jgi:hypothetical protein
LIATHSVFHDHLLLLACHPLCEIITPIKTSLSTLLSLQTIAICLDNNDDTSHHVKRPRVIERLVLKVISSSDDSLQDINLDIVLVALTDCVRAINNDNNNEVSSDLMLKPVKDMTTALLTELIESQRHLVTEAIKRLGLKAIMMPLLG